MELKNKIKEELLNANWKISEIGFNNEWWDDEHWKVVSNYNELNYFYLCFIIDPMFLGDRKKGEGIYEIKASSKFPSNWNDSSNTIASIQISTRKFDQKLASFFKELNKYQKDFKDK